MRYHWIRCRICQLQFKVIWQSGVNNHADYFTKVHPTAHHRTRRHLYVSTFPIGRHITSEMRVNGVCYTHPDEYNLDNSSNPNLDDENTDIQLNDVDYVDYMLTNVPRLGRVYMEFT